MGVGMSVEIFLFADGLRRMQSTVGSTIPWEGCLGLCEKLAER